MNEQKTPPHNLHTQDNHKHIYAEKVRLLHQGASANILGNAATSFFFIFVLWNESRRPTLIIWICLHLLVLTLRYLLVRSYHRRTPQFLDNARWDMSFTVGLAISGIIWGIGVFLVPDGSEVYHMLLMLIIGGMIAVAISSYAVIIKAFFAFSTPMLTCLIFRLFTQATAFSFTFNGLLLIFITLMAMSVRRENKTITYALHLQFENTELISYQTEEKNRIETLNATLQAEINERKRTQDAFIAERNQLRTLVDSLPDYIFVKDIESHFLLVNKTSAFSAGFTSPKEFIGKTDFDLFPAELAEKYYADDQEVLRSGQALLNKEEQCMELRTNTLAWRLTSKIPFQNSQGNIAGIVGISRDITERKLIEQSFRQHNRELILLNHLSDLLQTCLTEEKTYKIVMNICKQLFPSDSGSLYIFDDAQSVFNMTASWGNLSSELPQQINKDACHALRSNQEYCIMTSDNHSACPHAFIAPHDSGHLCVLINTQDDILGLLHLRLGRYESQNSSKELHDMIESKRLITTRIVRHYALFLSNLRLREALRLEAIRDPLTGLYNRRYMEEFLNREVLHAKRVNTSVAIIMIDIDHFKTFNDTYGHETGDLVLQELAHCLQRQIREDDIACRYGGEELLLILPEISYKHLKLRAEDIRLAVETLRIEHEGVELHITISLGAALIPHHGTDVVTVFKAADTALYQAKSEGRNCAVIASPPEE